MLVLDEADEMLSQGFKEQIYDIYRYLPPMTQVVLVSATLPREGTSLSLCSHHRQICRLTSPSTRNDQEIYE